MKSILILIFFAMSVNVFGMTNDCKEQLRDLMVTPSEKYLFKKHFKITEVFGTKCGEILYGDELIAGGSIVFIHEAAHFEDLHWGGGEVKPFNLYTVNNKHIGGYIGDNGLPAPKDLINPYVEQNKPEFLDEESVYMSMHEGYLLDDESMAAAMMKGLASELNGYTHGSVIQARNIVYLPDEVAFTAENGQEVTLPNPVKMISQLDGLMYFLYNHNLYLRLLKIKHPAKWNEFYNDHNKKFMKSMLQASIDTLVNVNHCEVRESYYNVDFYLNELEEENMSIFVDLLGEESVNKLLCRDLNLVVNRLDLDSSSLNNIFDINQDLKKQCS